MAEVTVKVNGRPYAVGCEDGQERHVQELAEVFDRHVRHVAGDVGQLSDSRLFLLGALLMADELSETRGGLAAASADLARVQAAQKRGESKAAAVLESAAQRIEALTAKAS